MIMRLLLSLDENRTKGVHIMSGLGFYKQSYQNYLFPLIFHSPYTHHGKTRAEQAR